MRSTSDFNDLSAILRTNPSVDLGLRIIGKFWRELDVGGLISIATAYEWIVQGSLAIFARLVQFLRFICEVGKSSTFSRIDWTRRDAVGTLRSGMDGLITIVVSAMHKVVVRHVGVQE